jgi:hypothetical protein
MEPSTPLNKKAWMDLFGSEYWLTEPTLEDTRARVQQINGRWDDCFTRVSKDEIPYPWPLHFTFCSRNLIEHTILLIESGHPLDVRTDIIYSCLNFRIYQTIVKAGHPILLPQIPTNCLDDFEWFKQYWFDAEGTQEQRENLIYDVISRFPYSQSLICKLPYILYMIEAIGLPKSREIQKRLWKNIVMLRNKEDERLSIQLGLLRLNDQSFIDALLISYGAYDVIINRMFKGFVREQSFVDALTIENE